MHFMNEIYLTGQKSCFFIGSLFQHIRTRSWRNRRMCLAPHRWRRNLFPRTLPEPWQPVRPPTAFVGFGLLKPLLCAGCWLLADPVAPTLVGMVDDPGNMAAATQDKAHLATHQLRDPPGRLPG